MKKFVIAAVSVLTFSVIGTAPAHAGSYCTNGTYSANSGKGTCSKNGGVNKNLPSFSDPGSSSYNRKNGVTGNSLNNNFGTKPKNNGYSGFNSVPSPTKKSNNGISNGLGSLSKKCPAFTSC